MAFGNFSQALVNYQDADFYDTSDTLSPSGNSRDAGFLFYDRWGRDRRKSGVSKPQPNINDPLDVDETITTGNIATASPTRLGTYLQNRPTSGSIVAENDFSELANFLIDIHTVLQPLDWQQDFEKVLGDLEYAGRVELNDGTLYSKKSLSSKRTAARKWYARNRGKLAKRRKQIKTNISAVAAGKQRQRMKKQKKNARGKPLRKYPTSKNHSNEGILKFKDYLEA